MNAIVYQSYRTQNVPGWIQQCLRIVPIWARAQGYEYRFFDEALFDRLPAWFRKRVSHRILPMSDLARLLLARELLDEGFDRVVWVDADVLIFDIKQFSVDLPGN